MFFEVSVPHIVTANHPVRFLGHLRAPAGLAAKFVADVTFVLMGGPGWAVFWSVAMWGGGGVLPDECGDGFGCLADLSTVLVVTYTFYGLGESVEDFTCSLGVTQNFGGNGVH